MWLYLKKYRYFIFAGVILLLALVFYSLNLRNRDKANSFERGMMALMAPLARGATEANTFFTHAWTDYIYLVDVRKENRKLLETVKILNTRLYNTQDALLENQRLKKLLDHKSTLHAPSLTATVIGEDGSPWFRTMVIDRGASDGLREGMPVLASDGVVGQLVKVAGNSSRVLMITDTASSVAGVVLRSRARGVVKGKGDGLCSLDFAEREDDVQVGDMVTTSGMGGIFPKGIPIGEVTMVKKGDYGIFQTIEIRPTVSATKLEEVVVILQQYHD